MTTQNKLLLTSLGLAGLGLGLGLRARQGLAQWHRTTLDAADEMEASECEIPGQTVDFSQLQQLPPPVERYLRFALEEGRPIITWACLHQSGALRLSEYQKTWRPFRAVQYIAAPMPGFVWDAQVDFGVGLSVHVRDAYVQGRGRAEVNALSLVNLATVDDKPELTAGALMRYLAEAVWVPTTLLPGAGIAWEPIDDYKALATLKDGNTTVSLEFHFGESGEVMSVYTPARYREVEDRYVPTPWRGVHRNYQVRNGMKIPTEAEVMWCLPDEALPVWKGRIESIDYVFTSRRRPEENHVAHQENTLSHRL